MVNQVIMLRNTQSSIIFIQQLGRGLRKHGSKEFVTIIDFIGNYKNNYLIPVALSGDNSSNKNGLRQDVNETHYISGLSAINFEEVAKERIYESINKASLDSMAVINEAYTQLKNRLGRIPMLTDFYQYKTIDPDIIATKKHTYYQYLVTRNEIEDTLSQNADAILKLITKEIATGHRLHELLLIEFFINKPEARLSFRDVKIFFKENDLPIESHIINNVINTLSCDFFVGSQLKTYKDSAILSRSDDSIRTTKSFKESLKNSVFLKLLTDLVTLGKLKNQHYNNQLPFTIHQRYRRRDTLRMLGWEKQMVDQNIGGYARDENNKNFVIFITLDKGEDFKGALMAYDDKLVERDTMHWFTKSKRTMNSPEVQILYNEAEYWNFYVFAKKSNDDDSTEFYYLGEVKPDHKTIKQTSRETSDGKQENIVHMDLKFINPIDHRLFKYLTSYEDFVD